ncbi:MAG: Txe/YoeB family addiction module toxin [Isosphaeraceae bacterium]|nr:Txe/YoeB family addiction module toxin [Isosphaeraceae bacterium]
MAKRREKEHPRAPRETVFHPEFREDLRYWVETDRKVALRDRKVALRVLALVEAILREPFAGVGKPEPLRHLLAGAWSRRITEEHRLVYLVRGNRVDFLQARYHY